MSGEEPRQAKDDADADSRFADDPVQANRLKEAKGIGTPATRDTIIEGLKRQRLLDAVKENSRHPNSPWLCGRC